MEKQKTITWRQLKNFCNKLNDTQLKKKVSWCGEERGGKVVSVNKFREDMINPSGEGIEPVSIYKEETNPDYQIEWEDEPVVFAKGTPIIWVD